MIAANSRTPALVLGDLRGQVGAARLGERRIGELMERYGKDVILESTELLSAHTENRVRQAIASWPDGESEGESFVDHDGIDLSQPIRIHVKVKKTGDRLHFDFSGSSDQTQGPANIRPPLVRAACAYCLVALVDRFLPINQGLARVHRRDLSRRQRGQSALSRRGQYLYADGAHRRRSDPARPGALRPRHGASPAAPAAPPWSSAAATRRATAPMSITKFSAAAPAPAPARTASRPPRSI